MFTKRGTVYRPLGLVLALVLAFTLLSQSMFHAQAESNPLQGKTISILGASISTYAGTSNGAAADTTNSTIRKNAHYYPHSVVTDVTLNDTWWMQACRDLGLRLLVNNSWSGSSLLHTRNGTVGAYVERCVQLHDDTGDNAGEIPDIIAIQMGTNDFQYYKDTLGTADIDYDVLIRPEGNGAYSYAEPTTSLEAAAIVLHKISVRYPDAEVYYLNISQRVDDTDALIRSFNGELRQVVEHFGAHIVDIYGSAITMEDFDTFIGDGRVHPNKLGMDVYTEAFKRALIDHTQYDITTHTVRMELDGVTADYGDSKIIASGDSFAVNLSAPAEEKIEVRVTMNGEDITASVWDGTQVTIDAVTADVTISAKAVHIPKNYRWEFDGEDLVSVAGENGLLKKMGTTSEGVFNETSYALETAVVLLHDQPWSVTWKSEGTFRNSSSSTGARVFSSDWVNANKNARYVFKSDVNGIVAMGEKNASGSHNYGIALGDYGIDWTKMHIYRLENRINDDGSNMVWLYVDGSQIGPLTHYYLGTKDQKTESDWLSGKDFMLPYLGTDTHGFTNAKIAYIQVNEGVHDHDYEPTVTPPTCNQEGYTTYSCTCGDSYVADYVDAAGHCWGEWEIIIKAQMEVRGLKTRTCVTCGEREESEIPAMQEAYPDVLHGHLQSLPEGVYAHTNLWNLLECENGYFYAGTHWGALDSVVSVTIPISPGDQIFASSFKRGIRVTYFGADGVLISVSATEIEAEFEANGYITAPDGAIAVNIPMWDDSADNVLKIMTLERKECLSHEFTHQEIQKEPGLVSKGSAIRFCENCGYSETVDIPELMLPGEFAYQDDGTSIALPYRIYYPSSYEIGAQTQYPIVIFYHGAGSRGDNNESQVLGKAIIDRLVSLDNCIIIAPQCDTEYQWVNTPWGKGSYDSKSIQRSIYMDASIALLDETIWTERVDENRVYAIGLSMGGYATWNAMMEYPEKFAAVVPICGAADPARANEVLGVAVWAFHGDEDGTVPVSGSREMIDAIRFFGGIDVRYTEYSGVGHASWVNAFAEPELTDWLFSQKKHIHSYSETVTEPTCTEQGYTTYTCFCGDSYVDAYVEATGHSYENGLCIHCGAHLPGDINGDGEVNNKDATRLFQYLTGWNVEVVEAALDVNGDGRINNKDATRLFQYLSGWKVEIH